MSEYSQPVVRGLRRRLLGWFDRHRRDLPWRRDRDPYRIWVSEVMLQQTRVATVIPYFERFLVAFPTLGDLAAAKEEEVLRLWEGLGYYRRARDLHRTARLLVAQNETQIPNDPARLAQLPGMGRYTVGAVLSQAYDRRLPILEANSQRVLCRLFGVRDDPTLGAVRRRLWELGDEVLPRRRAGEFNQALMELGALICTPVSPHCSQCPVAETCTANRLGLQRRIPVRAERARIVEAREVAVVVRKGQHVLLVQRPRHGRWAGLWEFPHGPLKDEETLEKAARRVIRLLTSIRIRLGPELMTVRHWVTHHRIEMPCFEADQIGGTFRSELYQKGLWVSPEQVADFPVSAPHRRLAKALIAPTRERRLF